MRTVNLRLLIFILLGMATLTGAVHALHEYQVHRQKPALLSEGQRYIEAKEWDKAIGVLNRYLILEPTNGEALADLGTTLFEKGRRQEAASILSRAIQILPERDDLRRKLVLVSLDLGRFQTAEYQLEEFLLKTNPADSRLLLQLGQSRARRKQFKLAVEALEKSLKANPTEFDALEELVQLELGPLETPGDALNRLNEAVEKNATSADPWRMRSQLYSRSVADLKIQQAVLGIDPNPSAESLAGRTLELRTRALADAKKALEFAPDDLKLLLLGATTARAVQDFEEARRLAEAAIKVDSKSALAYALLASVESEKRPPDIAAASERP